MCEAGCHPRQHETPQIADTPGHCGHGRDDGRDDTPWQTTVDVL
jgi:hypothetical protein